MSEQQAVLHKAEEYGQSRPYTVDEVKAARAAAILNGTGTAAVALLMVTAYWLWENVGWLATLLILAAPTGFFIGAGWVIRKVLNEQIDGLRSYREATSFAPPLPKPQAQTSNGPPILVHPYKGDSYMLGQPEKPALPGRQDALQITPPVVAEVLRASLEEYKGEWSRRKLMRLRIAGQRVSRGMYEELTAWLSRAGVLLQTRQGGYQLPPDVAAFEDLRAYFPNLPGLGGPGGNREGWERGEPQLSQPGDGAGTLAEQRRQRWLECDCDVKLYLGGEP